MSDLAASRTRARVMKHTLGNGLVLAAAENPSHPSVVLHLVAMGGQSVEPRDLAGVAEVTNRALVHRCQRLTPEAINLLLDEHGMTLTRGNNRHACEISVRCPSESLDAALDLLAELARRPLFMEDEVQAMVRQAIRSVTHAERDPRAAAVTEFRRLAYPMDHPYARQVYGTADSLARITRDHVEAFHTLHIQPQRCMLVVGGDVRSGELHERVNHAFGDWPPGHTEPREPDSGAPPPEGTRRDLAVDYAGQAEVIVGGPTLGRTEPGFRALHAATLILGQLGLNGRLGARLREREGLAYACYAALEDAPSAGLWTARASVAPADVERAVNSIRSEMRRMCDEQVSHDELEASRSFMRGAFALQLETNAGLASLLQAIATYNLGADYLETFPDQLNMLSAEAIQAACRTWLRADDPIIVTAAPTARP